MFFLKMVTFGKNADCPSSPDLLAFQCAEISPAAGKKIESHLTACEFCASEIEFYKHYPQSEDTVAKVAIPLPLLELAEALLGNKHKEFSTLNRLLCENESVKI